MGLRDPRRFFVEHRECSDRLAQLLRQHGRDARQAYRYLVERYFWYLGQGTTLTTQDAWHIFRGRPGLQLLMAARTFWFNRRQPSTRVHPICANDKQLGARHVDSTAATATTREAV